MMKEQLDKKTLLLLMVLGVFSMFSSISLVNAQEGGQKITETTLIVEWIENPSFNYPLNSWVSESEGDLTDVSSYSSPQETGFIVHGDSRIFNEVNGIPNASYGWLDYQPGVTPPDANGSDNYGLWAHHIWDETGGGQPYNTPHIQWKRNITLPVNMSDYKITSASLNAIVNASLGQSIDSSELPGDGDQGSEYDYADFYIQIADLDNNLKSPRLAELRIRDDTYDDNQNPGNYQLILDSLLTTVQEATLIHYLETIFAVDNHNLTIIVGIDIYSDDNIASTDYDEWDEMRFKSVNLTFTYVKKIDRFTSIAWSQVGDKIQAGDADDVRIENASVNFNYKIDKPWTTESPNTEIITKINNNEHTELIRLSDAIGTYQSAKSTFYDVSTLIPKNVNLKLSIELFIADNFVLESDYLISIDDVTFTVAYTLIYIEILPPGPDYTLGLVILSMIIIGLLAAFSSYQLYFRFPPKVRTIRKLTRQIKTGRPTTEILAKNRSFIQYHNFNKNLAPIQEDVTKFNLRKSAELTKREIESAKMAKPTTVVPLASAVKTGGTPMPIQQAKIEIKSKLAKNFSPPVAAGAVGATIPTESPKELKQKSKKDMGKQPKKSDIKKQQEISKKEKKKLEKAESSAIKSGKLSEVEQKSLVKTFAEEAKEKKLVKAGEDKANISADKLHSKKNLESSKSKKPMKQDIKKQNVKKQKAKNEKTKKNIKGGKKDA